MTVNKTHGVATVVLLLVLATPVSACNRGQAAKEIIHEGSKVVKEVAGYTTFLGVPGCLINARLCWDRDQDGVIGLQPARTDHEGTKG